MHPLLNIAISAAKKAGDIINKHASSLERIKISNKTPNDLVSEVDLKAEQAIIETIQKSYPSHQVIAEESGMHHASDDAYTWIIDPLDGTSNYLHGFPFYCVSIALQHKNKIEHAVVYDPIRLEFFTASRGAGARLNDKRIRVSTQTQFSKALIGTGFPFRDKHLSDAYFDTFKSIFNDCSGVRRAGAAALDLAYVASGRMDGFWEFSLQPWDMAAGSLLIKEAGGLVSDLSGGEQYLKTGHIAAGNPKILKAILKHSPHLS